jgi:predicted  nucleic acid-binding Zn-ribbon protein
MCVLLLGTPTALKADTVTLKSGEVLQGQILSETDTQIEFEVSLYHGTILTKREVPKSDIRSIVRESIEQKQEKAALAALGKYTLNPNQELTKDQYTAGIAAFEKFQATYTNSSSAAAVSQSLADWRAEASNVASGKVKFASKWMTPEEKKPQVERAQRQADVQAAQSALASLNKQLADLQSQRATLAGSVAAAQAKLTAARARLQSLQGTAGTASRSGGRRDWAGQLTAGVVDSSQREASQETGPNPETARVQNEITSYQQQVDRAQGPLGSLDAKIRDVQSQIAQREEDSKSALARLSELSTQAKTGTVQSASSKDTHVGEARRAPPPAPSPPWYMRAWKWLHG